MSKSFRFVLRTNPPEYSPPPEYPHPLPHIPILSMVLPLDR